MSERKCRAGIHIGVQIVRIDGSLMLVGGKDHQNVRPSRRIRICQDFEASRFSLLRSRRTGAQSDGNVRDATVAQVLCVGVALTAIADNRDLFVLDEAEVTIGVLINLHDIRFPLILTRFAAPHQANNSRPADLDKANFAHQSDECIDLVRSAGNFKNEAADRRVDDSGAVDVSEAHRFDALVTGTVDLDER